MTINTLVLSSHETMHLTIISGTNIIFNQCIKSANINIPPGKDFSPLQVIQIGSGAHPASYPMGNGGFSTGGLIGRGVKLTSHIQLVPRSRLRGSIHALSHTSSWRMLN
jgi:hypothetical protein